MIAKVLEMSVNAGRWWGSVRRHLETSFLYRMWPGSARFLEAGKWGKSRLGCMSPASVVV